MNSTIFRECLLVFNAKMAMENINTIVFLDNFSGHVLGLAEIEPRLTHVKVEWLPPNCTSIVQPVDQGLGDALKIRYRKYLHEYIGTQVMLGSHL